MATKLILDVDTGTDDAVARMAAALSPDLELVGAADCVMQRIAGYEATQPMLDHPNCAPIHDALAVCAIIEPSILTTRFIPVDVEVTAELSLGLSVCDFRSRPDKPANVHFATGADGARFVDMLTEIFGHTPEPSARPR